MERLNKEVKPPTDVVGAFATPQPAPPPSTIIVEAHHQPATVHCSTHYRAATDHRPAATDSSAYLSRDGPA